MAKKKETIAKTKTAKAKSAKAKSAKAKTAKKKAAKPDEPQYNEAYAGKVIGHEEVAACLQEADAAADDREDMPVNWYEVIPTPTQLLGIASFSIGQRFELELGAHDAHLEIAEIDDQGKSPDLGPGAPPQQSQFRLIFRGHSRRAQVPEGWYRIRNEELGEFEIYLSPVAVETNAAQHVHAPHLEAVFC